MAVRDAIKLELPMGVKKITFECRTPGPIDIEISIRKFLRSLSPWHQHTETQGLYFKEYGSFLLDTAAGPPVVDDSVTEYKSEPIAGNVKHAVQVLVSTGPLVNNSETELESDIQPSLEFPEPAIP
ncbi:hypothetical protein BDR07DRAFT_1466389 [Suillus spraguei]|nr:hypothetical protein BDR07DRAFT_1466389 [Suillus spraguei]